MPDRLARLHLYTSSLSIKFLKINCVRIFSNPIIKKQTPDVQFVFFNRLKSNTNVFSLLSLINYYILNCMIIFNSLHKFNDGKSLIKITCITIRKSCMIFYFNQGVNIYNTQAVKWFVKFFVTSHQTPGSNDQVHLKFCIGLLWAD